MPLKILYIQNIILFIFKFITYNYYSYIFAIICKKKKYIDNINFVIKHIIIIHIHKIDKSLNKDINFY
ncbi:hypothetical protein C923_03681 [Plasmodium falciparum UGT5.1]|uniref:Uncharacterized protein n=3 Tax=Plasmodium falciparum TaxID=5833 RepID=A0A024X7U8_PLAFC|nr:hypothetical protein PFNF135_03761 [Plasmodium falciparum NF135/5.C10]ETW60846.1 hypothetical protein PFMC_03545 [Plasmodium falciparum CAMP/Malaysia]EWC75640.1 hypothetical protein C923_03681 [Plasmodium falciparum UGT5.1]